MFYFMLLVWADTHIDSNYPEYVSHPLEGTYTEEIIKKCYKNKNSETWHNLINCLHY